MKVTEISAAWHGAIGDYRIAKYDPDDWNQQGGPIQWAQL